MNTRLWNLCSISLLVAASLFMTVPALAAPAATIGGSTSSAATANTLYNPIPGTTTLNEAIGKVINAALGLSGAIALLMFVWGGVQMLISGGNPKLVTKGKDTLTWAAIGIVVIFTAYTLVNVVVNTLSGVTK